MRLFRIRGLFFRRELQ